MEQLEELLATLKQAVSYDQIETIVNELAQLGRQSNAVVTKLIEILADPDPEFSDNIAIALGKMGPIAVNPLFQTLRDPIPQRRIGAARAIVITYPFPDEAESLLIRLALHDPSPEVRKKVIQILSIWLRSAAQKVVISLFEDFTHPDPEVRNQAAIEVGCAGKLAIEPLTKILIKPNQAVEYKRLSLIALNIISENSLSTEIPVQLYKGLANDPDRVVRFQLLKLLRKAAPSSELLVILAKDADEQIRNEAMSLVATKGIQTEEALNWLVEQILDVEKLADQTHSPDKDEREMALERFRRLEKAIDQLSVPTPVTDKAVAIFTQLFLERGELNLVNHLIMRAFQALGFAANNLVPHLLNILSKPQETKKHDRFMAASLLGSIGAGNEAVVTALLDTLSDASAEYSVKRAAVTSLGSLGAELVGTSIQKLKDILNEVEPALGIDIAQTLGNLEPTYTPALNYLIAILDRNEDRNLTKAAVWPLTPFGSMSKPAIPTLVKLFITASKAGLTNIDDTILTTIFSKLDKEFAKQQLRQALEDNKAPSEVARRIRNMLWELDHLNI